MLGIQKLSPSGRKKLSASAALSQVAVLIVGLLTPLLMSGTASAAQLTSRFLTVGTSKPTTASTWTYGFTTPATTNIGSIKFEVCTTPLNSCTSPGAGLDVNVGATSLGSGWTSANAFTRNATGAGSCTAAANVLCTARATAASETNGARTITQTLQVNPTAVGTFYVRITTYSDTAWATSVDTGVVAGAVVNQLTVNARIQEVLSFCVGTTSSNDATTSVGADCSAVSGTTVDIGVLDPTAINVSPVSTNGGTNTNGVAMLRTNGQSGATVSYFSEQDTSSGRLKVAGATCSGSSTTDQCINDSATQGTFTAGTEAFGMTVAGTNCGSTTAYSCVLTSGTNNLKATSPYIGATATSYGVTAGYAWQSNGTTVQIASSSTVVDDEALILRFAATPNITTPYGSYTVTSTYIATTTY